MSVADTNHNNRIAVIGGGWAGCAAAVELVKAGHPVTLFESTRVLGGRARGVCIDEQLLDNGQHILLGAYRESLKLMETVGIDIGKAFLRLPLQMCYPPQSGGMYFMAPRLPVPAPWHMLIALLRAKGLEWADKLALARFSTTARWMEWRMHQDCTVSELLERFDQTPRLIKLMWRPLCLAALNTPMEQASAQVFLNVLRDSLGARRAASDMLLPRLDLSALFPQHAAHYIEQHQGEVRYGTQVKKLSHPDDGWRLSFTDQSIAGGISQENFKYVVLATPIRQSAELLDGLIDTSLLTAFTYEPITTCYLRYAPELRLPAPFYALVDDEEKEEWGQFVFDRGQLMPDNASILSVVVSAASAAIGQDQKTLSAAIATQIARSLNMPQLARPLWSKVVSEKRATFACIAGLQRPANAIGLTGLVLAGDYTAGDYPATLEAAVRSGVQAARHIAQETKHAF